MRLLVGLGNPGHKYERTRHNVGFRIAAEAARKLGIALDQERWDAVLGTGRARSEHLAVVLPQTFMNASGESVAKAARFWKTDPSAIVVAHDELDLPFGRIQVKVGGGAAGHNGLRSLHQHLGDGYLRVRFGIGKAPPLWEGADWVLAKFTPEEETQLGELVPQAAEAAVAALLEGPGAAMNKFNRRPAGADEAPERADDGSRGSPAAARGGTGGGRSRPPDEKAD
ncbi:MAG: aminoacyl-tRNA hydrolase [Deltaproteobacteria bacterium]|nr:MAG: aminoacyl-tRNA hydrolase [Deltaproteobacteria bacterium]